MKSLLFGSQVLPCRILRGFERLLAIITIGIFAYASPTTAGILPLRWILVVRDDFRYQDRQESNLRHQSVAFACCPLSVVAQIAGGNRTLTGGTVDALPLSYISYIRIGLREQQNFSKKNPLIYERKR